MYASTEFWALNSEWFLIYTENICVVNYENATLLSCFCVCETVLDSLSRSRKTPPCR
jgi:hypothetical protein